MAEAPRLLLDHQLKSLKLPTVLREYDKQARIAAGDGVDHVGYLARLTELELIDRERRLVERRIKQARFPIVKQLESFDFKAVPELNKMLVLDLARGEYVARRENVILLGPSGVGKTHIALALGLAACQKGLSVRFTTASQLVHELMEARDEKRLLRLQAQLAKVNLLIVASSDTSRCRRPGVSCCPRSSAYVHARAVPDLPIRAAAIDTGGHHTKAAYEFCRTRLAHRIWAIKGRGGTGVPVWPRRPTRTNKGKIPLFIVGVDAVKDALLARLKLTEPGPGAVHFQRRLDAEYFRQLTAERVVTRFEKGRPIRSWRPKRDGERNEALDTFVYASAGLHGLISMGLRLNEEAEAIAAAKRQSDAPALPAKPAPPVIRSAWMG